MHVRKGDQVKVIAGNYRGTQGRVLRVLPRRNRVVIEGVNMRKKHERPSQANPEGGIVTMEMPIHASNVMLVCPHCEEPSRVRRQHDPDGTLERLCARCGSPIPTSETP
jgi:large subunit ribosomal protein L24